MKIKPMVMNQHYSIQKILEKMDLSGLIFISAVNFIMERVEDVWIIL